MQLLCMLFLGILIVLLAHLIACCPSVRLSVNSTFTFLTSSPGLLSHFNQNWHKSSWGKGIQNCSNEGQHPCPRGDNSNLTGKVHWKFVKLIFSRTSRPISIKLGTNHLWVKRTENCSSKGQACSNCGSCGLWRSAIWKTILHVFIFGKKSLNSPEPAGQFQSNV
jgi:hypothetical protein